MKTPTYITVLFGAALLASCKLYDQTGARIDNLNGPIASSRIKFNNFSSGSVGVNFFANTAKMTGVNFTTCSPGVNASLPTNTDTLGICKASGIESTTGTTYSGNAAGGFYLAIAPGSYTLTAKMPRTDTLVSTVTQTIADGKYYSMFMSGIYSATGNPRAEAFVVEDPIPAAKDYTKANLRLVNALPNGTGALTLYATNTTTNTEVAVGSAVAYKAAGTFVELPEGVYNVVVRYTGSATNVISRTTLSLIGGRVYTVTSRGNTGTASTLGLDFTENQR